jgi:hypothetical protein
MRTIRTLAADAGLRIDEERYAFRWTAAAKLATRAVEALVPSEPAPPSVPIAPVNRALYALSRMEERLFGSWPPFGSSLLVVGGRQQDGASAERSPRVARGAAERSTT